MLIGDTTDALKSLPPSANMKQLAGALNEECCVLIRSLIYLQLTL